ncbi:MAG: glutamine synthetase family protein [Gammaproteobacteria bacterium]|nr:glutamine synthetase family protein [Gammaproteobacteria bacterium]
MKREPLIIAATSDIAGKVRGKSFPASQLEKRLERGVGWTPTNVQITCFDSIADSPYGALGDLVMIPDLTTYTELDFQDGQPIERFVLGNIHETNGSTWECCTRSILRAAIERLESVANISLFGAFEHEFHLVSNESALGNAYTTSGFRAQREFAEVLVTAINQAGLRPDTFMKEYGIDQYEITIGPVLGFAIADHATILRELVRICAERLRLHSSFTPLRDPMDVGNGVHIHMSLCDKEGNAITYDSKNKYGLSQTAGQFIAGILKYLDSIVALTAPSVISYSRLIPHRWSSAFNNLGFRDREAAVRICPVNSLSDIAEMDQFNFEFRATDAAASPYLALAAIVHAGTQGIEEELDFPVVTEEDLSLLSESELYDRNIVRLPETLEIALERFTSNETVIGWFPHAFADVYIKHKQGEMAYLSKMTETEIYAAYASVY